MQGRIVKGIAGFYYVHIEGSGLYECKAKGIFRNRKIKPLVGDFVEIEILNKEGQIGNLIDILPRKNCLIRPAIANTDQAMIVFAVTNPEPNLNLLDRFLILMQQQEVETIICFNKKDQVDISKIEQLKEIYQGCGCKIFFVSAKEKDGMKQLEKQLHGKTTVLAGPSGVGKSTIVNLLQTTVEMEIGNISEKIKRGKHTTRHSELIYCSEKTYLFDTPGFSSLFIEKVEKEELKDYFFEFYKYEGMCRFHGCIHLNEPDCMVKEALESKKISRNRYENYQLIYEELKNKKKY